MPPKPEPVVTLPAGVRRAMIVVGILLSVYFAGAALVMLYPILKFHGIL